MTKLTICNLLLLTAFSLPTSSAAEDLSSLEQQAITAAVDRVAPSVVQIETIGGLEQADDVPLGTGPTSGWIVDPDGYIISSAFNFINQPTSILVRLPDGTRKPARRVATDHSRRLVLLKIETDHSLPVCEISPEKEIRVGQWAVAVGRTFEVEQPNFNAGIISALDRIWGKAIQTDAAVSPNNYGGPLVDLRGRVLGVLVPLSPDSSEEVAGVEWYDSGIGFAIPAEHVQQILPRLKKGEDLQPGLAGLNLKARNSYIGNTEIGVCRPKSPAAAAGLKPGDRITEIDGRKIARAAEVKEQIARRYAGDTLKFIVFRGSDRLEKAVTLAEKLEPYQHPWLGILPRRDPGSGGVAVRYVFPDSPAQKAHILAGDVITSFQGKPVKKRNDLLDALASLAPEDEAEIVVQHDGKSEKRKLMLGMLTASFPPKSLPLAHEPPSTEADEGSPTGVIPLKVAEFANEANAYVPADCRTSLPHGVVLWLHGAAGCDWAELLNAWKPLCDAHDLILVAPKSTDHGKWSPLEILYFQKLLAQLAQDYTLDPLRIVVAGEGAGGTMASFLAIHNPGLIQGLVLIDAPFAGSPPENDPQHRLSVYWATFKKSPSARSATKGIAKLQEMKVPLVVKDSGEAPRSLTDDELSELARWIDALDRM
jgi:serine protease Do